MSVSRRVVLQSGAASIAFGAPTDDGGSPITGYNIRRNGSVIASQYTGTTYVDLTATDKAATYRYSFTAVNALGESAASNDYAPAVDENAPVTAAVCTLPGQLYLDQTGEPGAELPPIDLSSLSIAEPQDQDGKLVFTVEMQAGGGSMKLGFDHPGGRRYSIFIKPTGTTVGYTDGRWFSDATATLNNIQFTRTDAPALDSSSFDATGTYTAVLDKAAWGLKTGDVLRNVTAFGLLATGNGQVFLRDFLGYDISHTLVGNDFCTKGAHLPAPIVNAAPPVVVPTPGSSGAGGGGRFGGALSLIPILLLLGAGVLRRQVTRRGEAL